MPPTLRSVSRRTRHLTSSGATPRGAEKKQKNSGLCFRFGILRCSLCIFLRQEMSRISSRRCGERSSHTPAHKSVQLGGLLKYFLTAVLKVSKEPACPPFSLPRPSLPVFSILRCCMSALLRKRVRVKTSSWQTTFQD